MNVQPSLDGTWIWKGISNSRDLLGKGACWSIKKGYNVNIWCDSWIPSLRSFRPPIKPNALLPRGVNKVIDLIDSKIVAGKSAIFVPFLTQGLLMKFSLFLSLMVLGRILCVGSLTLWASFQ